MAVNERFSALSSEMRDQLQEFQSSTRNQIETLISQQEANEKKHDEQFHFVQKFLYRTLTGIVIVAGLVIYKLFFR
jgi:HPt (histidine-containing phosphotransfer) domain-containing protein